MRQETHLPARNSSGTGSGEATAPTPGAETAISEPAAAAETTQEELEVWRERALRLQAEMENYRKRQRRQAEERIYAERERLLQEVLSIVDDLERALTAETSDAASLRQGVALIYQSLVRLLDREGIESIRPEGEPFDPLWHEAVGTVPSQSVEAEPNTVVRVVQEGYRLGDRLLRPSRVIIAD